jgi:hypothetical protein
MEEGLDNLSQKEFHQYRGQIVWDLQQLSNFSSPFLLFINCKPRKINLKLSPKRRILQNYI